MKPALKILIATGLLGAAALFGAAQAADAPASGGPQCGPMWKFMHMSDAKRSAMVSKHLAALKAKLQITAQQESAWSAFTDAMKPLARPVHDKAAAAELDQLSTPERIDKLHALRTQRMAERSAAMDKRDEAVKSLYAALTPAQQKTFDEEHTRMVKHMEGHHPQ